MDTEDKIFVAGHRGLLGSALVRRLQAQGYARLLTRTHAELDLTDQAATRAFFEAERPDYVLLAAAKVGGIWANQRYPADFISTNLLIETAVIHAAYEVGVKRLLFFGSTCAYPRDCPQPMREEHLLAGRLEPTSLPYAVAKIAGMTLCDAFNRQRGTCFISAIPATLYGPNDNFDPKTSHVLSALMHKFHQAKMRGDERVALWGTGAPRREFLYSDDMAEACIALLQLDEPRLRAAVAHTGSVINVGFGSDVSILELARRICEVVGYDGELEFDSSRPDGAPRKLLDSSRIAALGWSPKVSLDEGVRKTYEWYQTVASRSEDCAR